MYWAGAVNQAIKAVAIARGFLIPTGYDISCAPTFSEIEIGGESRTAIRIRVYVHTLPPATDFVEFKAINFDGEKGAQQENSRFNGVI